MEQLRKAFAWLKQHHFWVLSVLVAVIGLACWWKSAGTMSKQYDDSQRLITGTFQSLDTVKNSPFHPNEKINKHQLEEINKLSAEVLALWQKLYDAQSQGVLVWPNQPGELNANFRNEVEKLPFGATIPDNLREHYQNYIMHHFRKLPEKIGARAIEDNASGVAGGGGFSRAAGPTMERGGGIPTNDGSMQDDENYLCVWDPANQAEVQADLVFKEQPNSIRIWVTQENLWVYHTMLDVIKNVNAAAGATRMSNAAVRTVYMLEVGKKAAPFSRTPNRIYQVPSAAPAAADLGAVGGEQPAGSAEQPAGGEREVAPGGDSGSGPMSEAQETSFLLANRYLGDDGKPIAAAPVTEAPATDPSVPGAAPAAPDLSAYGKEYKRLPVRMVLQMDQRHLPRLITECAIRPLQIEVQEVRINPMGDIGSGGAGSGMLGPAGRGGFGGGGDAGGANLFPQLAGLQDFNPQPQLATVVIQGVIYIFNKPNAELLKPAATPGTTEPPLAQVQ